MACTEEQKEYARRWYAANKEKLRARVRAAYAKNKDKVLAANKAWKAANRERVLELNRASRRRNPETIRRNSKAAYQRRKQRLGIEGLRAEQRERRKQPKYKAINAEATTRRRLAARACLNKDKVMEFYREAQRLTLETGIPHEVDHIIPLKHPRICGLHNEFNLRVITAEENGRKKNKFDVDAYNESIRGIV